VAITSAVRDTHGSRVRSTLAAEVARLDAARTALEIGAFDEALRLVTRFHRDFPNGELATEADVLRIEALSARNDQAGARREAARFLERHGNDPHADRVRQIATATRPRAEAAPKPTPSK
jgi:outer membrane protein assembly factor BamD (BamD/ComL family)